MMTKFDAKKEKRRLKKWLEDKWTIETGCDGIEKKLADEVSWNITTELGMLESWFGHQGNYLVLESDVVGWADLRRCFEYAWLSTRITSVFQDRATKGAAYIGDHQIALPFAIAFGEHRYAHWLGDRLLDHLDGKTGKFTFDGPPVPLTFAFLCFYALWRKRPFNIKDHTTGSLGVYQAILDGWNDEKKYVKACLKACDYHVEMMHEEEGYSEFLGAPQDLLPVEMLMIRRIRADLGLPNPEIDHPLMQTPLGQAPKSLPDVKDELLERVLAKASKELAGFPQL